MEESNFKELFQRIVAQYELAPEAAAELLRRILAVLNHTENPPLPTNPKYEILKEHTEREDNP